MMTAILQVGAGAIRPGQAYLGTLCRVDGETLHVISEAEAAGYERKPGAVSSPVGTVMPLTETFVGVLLDAGGGTRSWEDLEASDAIANPAYARVRGLGWRALITTTFVAGATTYSLAFTSATPAAKPFGSQDRAFIEVLASFFSAYFQQHWQSTRIGHQLEHDSLTGVRNRMRLRSLGRAAFDRKTPAAIAIVNLVQMQRLNETYGHLTGDAVLVEVAAALTSKALEGEIVARVGGSTFAIFFPSAPSRDWVAEAVQRFGATFDARMGIGDREGKESLPVSARIGFARAPDDAQTFDELLLSAEGRARTTSLHPDQRSFPVG
jgi:diguanylate cyclase (GGDEF)-like protein